MKPKKIVVIIFIFLIICTCVSYFFITRWWERWDFDQTWSDRVIHSSSILVKSLKRYGAVHKGYPKTYEQLGSFTPPIPHPVSGPGKWHYKVLSRDEFEIYVPCMNRDDSFDALVFRSKGGYPPEWSNNLFETHHVFSVDGWLYITNFSDLIGNRSEIK